MFSINSNYELYKRPKVFMDNEEIIYSEIRSILNNYSEGNIKLNDAVALILDIVLDSTPSELLNIAADLDD